MNLSRTTILSTCLFLSLVGNVTLGGMMAGKQAGHESVSPSLRSVVRLMKDLPPASQQKVQAVLQPAQDTLYESYHALTVQRQHIADLLAAPQIDKAALQEAFANYRTMVTSIEVTSQTALLDSAMLLTPEERKRMIEPMRHAIPHGNNLTAPLPKTRAPKNAAAKSPAPAGALGQTTAPAMPTPPPPQKKN